MTPTAAPSDHLPARTRPRRGAVARRSRRLAVLGIAMTAVLGAAPALDVARAADGPPPPLRPAARVHPERPASTVDLVRTAREPRPAQLGHA